MLYLRINFLVVPVWTEILVWIVWSWFGNSIACNVNQRAYMMADLHLTARAGQTGCHISTRISEHIWDTRLEKQQAVGANHSTTTKQSIDFDKTKVTANIHSYCPHIIRETAEITKYLQNLICNREDGYRLSNVWLHLFPPNHPPNNN
jgi:hypothetical protein